MRQKTRYVLTALGGISEVLKCSHSCLCPLHIFSFSDVEVLGRGLFRRLCCWLNKNIMSQHPSKRLTATQNSRMRKTHTGEQHLTLYWHSSSKSHLLQQMHCPKRTFSLEGQDLIKPLYGEACCPHTHGTK